MAEAIGALRVELSANRAQFEKDMAAASATVSAVVRQLQGFTRSLTTVGTQLTNVGRSLTVGLTAPLVAVGTGAAHFAIQFESAFAGVRKTVTATEPEFKVLEQGFRDLSKEIPVTATELAKIGEAGGALGIGKENILGFTKVVAGMAEATNLTAEQAANDFAKIANITKLPQTQFENLGSAIVALGNEGASSESDITAMALRLSAAGQTAGLSTPQILGFAASMANVGLEAEAGGSALSKTLREMVTAVAEGGTQLETFAGVAGLSASKFKELFERDAAGALRLFISELGKLGGPGALGALDALGIAELRQVDTLLRLANSAEKMGASVDLSTEAFRQNTALSKETEERYKTTEAQLALVKNAFVDIGISVGNALLPAIRALADSLRDMAPRIQAVVDWFLKLPEWVQVAAGVTALAAALAGPLLIALGQVATGIGTVTRLAGTMLKGELASQAATWTRQLVSANGALGGLGTTLRTFATRFGLANAATSTGSALLAPFSSLAAGAGVSLGTMTIAVGAAAVAGGLLGRSLLEAGDKIRGLEDPIRTAVKDVSLLEGAWILVKDAAGGLGSVLFDLGSKVVDITGKMVGIEGASKLVGTALSNIAQSASLLGEQFFKLGQAIYGTGKTTENAAAEAKLFAEASQIAGVKVTDWSTAIQLVNQKHAELRDATAASTAATKEQTEETDFAAVAEKIRADAMKGATAALEQKKEADKKAADEAKKHTEEVKKLAASLGEGELAAKIKLTEEALKQLGGMSKVNVDELQRLATEFRGTALGAEAAAEMDRRLAEAKDYLVSRTEVLSTALPGLAWNIRQTVTDVEVADHAWNRFGESIDRSFGRMERATAAVFTGKSGYVDLGKSVETLDHAFEAMGISADSGLRKMVGGMAAGMAGAQGLGDAFKFVATSIDIAKMQGGSFTDGLKAGLQNLDIGALIASIGQIAGAFQSGMEQGTAGARAIAIGSLGASLGGTVGSLFGGKFGEKIGQAIGGLAGALVGIFHKPEWKKVMDDVGKEFGVNISEGLAKQIAEDSKKIGDRYAAELKHLGAIFKEAGGVAAFGLGKAIDKTKDLFTALERGQLTADEVGKTFNEVFAEMLPVAIDATTGRASAGFLELIQLSREFGIESAAVNDFVAQQAQTASDSLATAISAGVATEGGALAFGAAVAVQFDELIRRGMSMSEAMKVVGPAIAALREELERTGFSGGAAFDAIAARAAILGGEVTGPLVTKIDAITQAMVALENQNLLSAETFAGLAGEVTATMAALEAEGVAHAEAMAIAQPGLQRIWELQQDYNYAVDETTQQLLNEAEAAGVVGDAHRSAQDRMAEAAEKTVEVLEAMAKHMGVIIPTAARLGAQGVEDAFAGIRVPPITVPYEYQQQGGGLPGGGSFAEGEGGHGRHGGLPEFAVGGAADFGGGTLAALHGRELIAPADGDSAIVDQLAASLAAKIAKPSGGGDVYLDGMKVGRVIENLLAAGAIAPRRALRGVAP